MIYEQRHFINIPGDNILDRKSLFIYVYVSGKGQVMVNIKNVTREPSMDFKVNTEEGINMDLMTFYMLVKQLEYISDGLYFGEDDNDKRPSITGKNT